MKRPSRPLWKLLIVFSEPDPGEELSCDECFNVLEHLAGEAVRGLELKYLEEAIIRHFELCPDCREHHISMLAELEDILISRK